MHTIQKHFYLFNPLKLDILAFAAHPDDVELACCGTLLKHIAQGKKVGIVDLTRGELGTRGTAELRAKEAQKSSDILGIAYRVNLGMPDGFFENNAENQLKIMAQLRHTQPTIVLANALQDRHPDHAKAAKLVADACFYSGLLKIKTSYNDQEQTPHRPKALYHYIQDTHLVPNFVVDISAEFETKIRAIRAFSSQFYDEMDSSQPETPISSKTFWDFIQARGRDFGRSINVNFAEGFNFSRTVGVSNLFDLE